MHIFYQMVIVAEVLIEKSKTNKKICMFDLAISLGNLAIRQFRSFISVIFWFSLVRIAYLNLFST